MNGNPKGVGRADDETQVSAAGQVSGFASEGARETARKKDQDAEWQSMTTGDPALYLKDPA